mmetsp:Transcript_35227/g.80654  ORF Transcript_35227/g.80654 Transcript_35227/m.80654 type:complete len:680 (+) Transcript_35227:52-2091(+)
MSALQHPFPSSGWRAGGPRVRSRTDIALQTQRLSPGAGHVDQPLRAFTGPQRSSWFPSFAAAALAGRAAERQRGAEGGAEEQVTLKLAWKPVASIAVFIALLFLSSAQLQGFGARGQPAPLKLAVVCNLLVFGTAALVMRKQPKSDSAERPLGLVAGLVIIEAITCGMLSAAAGEGMLSLAYASCSGFGVLAALALSKGLLGRRSARARWVGGALLTIATPLAVWAGQRKANIAFIPGFVAAGLSALALVLKEGLLSDSEDRQPLTLAAVGFLVSVGQLVVLASPGSQWTVPAAERGAALTYMATGMAMRCSMLYALQKLSAPVVQFFMVLFSLRYMVTAFPVLARGAQYGLGALFVGAALLLLGRSSDVAFASPTKGKRPKKEKDPKETKQALVEDASTKTADDEVAKEKGEDETAAKKKAEEEEAAAQEKAKETAAAAKKADEPASANPRVAEEAERKKEEAETRRQEEERRKREEGEVKRLREEEAQKRRKQNEEGKRKVEEKAKQKAEDDRQRRMAQEEEQMKKAEDDYEKRKKAEELKAALEKAKAAKRAAERARAEKDAIEKRAQEEQAKAEKAAAEAKQKVEAAQDADKAEAQAAEAEAKRLKQQVENYLARVQGERVQAEELERRKGLDVERAKGDLEAFLKELRDLLKEVEYAEDPRTRSSSVGGVLSRN